MTSLVIYSQWMARSRNKGLGTQEMSYGTCESAGERTIGLNQDKKKIGRKGGSNKRTTKQNGCRPTPRTQGALTAHESNPPALAAKLDKFAYTSVSLYTDSHSRGRNAHTRLK